MLLRLAACLVAPLLLVACSGSGGSHKTTGRSAACPLITQLDTITSEVTQADVANPAGFKTTLDRAVARYVAVVDRLKKETPATLQPDLDKVAAAVHQYRFEDAGIERASLDEYAATKCGRVASPASTTTTTTGTGDGGGTFAPATSTSSSTP